MITSLRLINFKTFENQLLEFRPLTLLSGLNSTGKSSVLQSFLLLRQSYQQELLPNTGLALNGELINIGTAYDAFCERAKDDYLGFEVSWKDEKKAIWYFNYDLEKKDSDVLNLNSEKIDAKVYRCSLFNKNFHYLQAERLGPRPSYDMSDYQVRRLNQLGTRGEYTAHFLAINEDKEIPNKLLRHQMAKSNTLSSQVEGWIREVSPGTRIKITSNSDMGLMSLQYFYGDTNPLVEKQEEIFHASRREHLLEHVDWIKNRLRIQVSDGLELWNRRQELFPSLDFCEDVSKQIQNICSGNPILAQVAKRLFELDTCCQAWTSGSFNLDNLPCKATPESESRLKQFQTELTFKCPDSQNRLFSLHVRMTPGAWRLYFSTDMGPGKILIGYVGLKIE